MDVIECRAAGHEPKEALRHGLRASTLSWTFCLDGKPAAMIGVVPASFIDGHARIWMLGTDEVDRAARVVVKLGPRLLGRIRGEWPRLDNLVAVNNSRAVRFLRWLGFAFDEEVRYVGGVAFRRFSIGF